ncbi:MAG: hypothetical protein R3F13_11730 [Prosthecobacter sp.]
MITLKARTLISTFSLFILVIIPACDKPERLAAEAASLEAQRKLILAESEAYDQRLRTANPVGSIGDTQTLEFQKRASQTKATEAELKLQKWTAWENQLKPLKEKAADYKSKYP